VIYRYVLYRVFKRDAEFYLGFNLDNSAPDTKESLNFKFSDLQFDFDYLGDDFEKKIRIPPPLNQDDIQRFLEQYDKSELVKEFYVS
jgi:hypothetical protein